MSLPKTALLLTEAQVAIWCVDLVVDDCMVYQIDHDMCNSSSGWSRGDKTIFTKAAGMWERNETKAAAGHHLCGAANQAVALLPLQRHCIHVVSHPWLGAFLHSMVRSACKGEVFRESLRGRA